MYADRRNSSVVCRQSAYILVIMIESDRHSPTFVGVSEPHFGTVKTTFCLVRNPNIPKPVCHSVPVTFPSSKLNTHMIHAYPPCHFLYRMGGGWGAYFEPFYGIWWP